MREGNFVVESAYIDEGKVQYCTEFVDRMVRFNETERTAKYLNSLDDIKTIDGVYHIYEETVDGGVSVYMSTGRPYLSDNGLKLIWEDECDCDNCNGCDEELIMNVKSSDDSYESILDFAVRATAEMAEEKHRIEAVEDGWFEDTISKVLGQNTKDTISELAKKTKEMMENGLDTSESEELRSEFDRVLIAFEKLQGNIDELNRTMTEDDIEETLYIYHGEDLTQVVKDINDENKDYKYEEGKIKFLEEVSGLSHEDFKVAYLNYQFKKR